jgi:exodeoxyribonuclease III
MKIATWNVNGIRARHQELTEWAEREQPDVICLQEIKAGRDQLPALLCNLEGYWCYWHGDRGYSGVAMLVSQHTAPERPEFSHPPFDFEHRIVTAKVPFPSGSHANELIVASTYVPNGGKDYPAKIAFLEALESFLGACQATGVSVVLCGDINVARTDMDIHPKERKPNLIGTRPEERALVERILARGVVDVGRAVDPTNDALFTWWAPWRNLRQRNIGWRLDYVIASESLHRRTVSCQVQRDVGTSDHAPVVYEFE